MVPSVWLSSNNVNSRLGEVHGDPYCGYIASCFFVETVAALWLLLPLRPRDTVMVRLCSLHLMLGTIPAGRLHRIVIKFFSVLDQRCLMILHGKWCMTSRLDLNVNTSLTRSSK